MSSEKELFEMLKEDFEKLEGKVDSGFRDLNTKIDVFMSNYVHKDIFKEMKDEWKDKFEKLQKEKVDKDTFEPIQKTLSRLNWIVIGAVVAGVLALVLK